MQLRFLMLPIILFSSSTFACLSCEEDYKDAQFVSFSEPYWSENDVPEIRKGSVTARFDVADSGKPYNIQILRIVPDTLDESKLIKSIQSAQFTVYRIDCDQKKEMNKKDLTYTFDLLFDNVR